VNAKRPVVFFYVQHLRGVGHAVRASRIARALVDAGCSVFLAWGGTRLPAVDLSGMVVEWLPAVKSPDDDYARLVDGEGREVDEAFLEVRRVRLLALLHRVAPDIVITETWPFGRRQMRFELEPLTHAAYSMRDRPLLVSSVRDILQENRKPERVRESLGWFAEYFDLLLVHGDPQLIEIGATLPGADTITEKIRYTGLVSPPPPDLDVPPTEAADVVVAAGGGAFGQKITAAARDAMSLSKRHPTGWLVIAGSERPQSEFEALRRTAPDGMEVVRHVSNLARVFAAARVCVTLAGYNTMCDLLRAQARAVVVSHSGGRETEQKRRAALLAERGLAIALSDSELTSERLAGAVDAASVRTPMQADFELNGAANSARILIDEWKSGMGMQER
jgi:predicted glycosyltransferase